MQRAEILQKQKQERILHIVEMVVLSQLFGTGMRAVCPG